MATSSSTSSVATRYARSLFELAAEAKAVDKVEASLSGFETLLGESDDLQRFISSPVISGDEQEAAMGAILGKAKVDPLVSNFLKVVASNRRLFALPGIIAAFRDIAADARGEVTADVTSATALNATQTKQLQAALKEVAGKDVAINATVDPSILGGLIVKMGSKQIDTSLKTKLSTLKLALKEVG
ncbi:MAG: F0F1 ATP synthase subunit delta [Pseudomonadota bacterium]